MPPEKIRNKLMKCVNVIFAGCAKNVEPFIAQNLKRINACGRKFNSYEVIIYENDSDDDTRNILIRMKQDNYHYIFEDNVCEPARTLRLANARNKLLEKMRELIRDNEYHYMIMMDLDDINCLDMFVDTIETCFDYGMNDWEVMTANQHGGYYDLWALRHKTILNGDIWKDKRYNTEIRETDKGPQRIIILPNLYFKENGLIRVDSAFGGMAIYKISAIPETAKYVGRYGDNEKYTEDCPIKDISDYNQKCEHVDFNKSIVDAGGRIYINTSFFNNVVG